MPISAPLLTLNFVSPAFEAALTQAVAAERAAGPTCRSPHKRIAKFVCEAAKRLGGPTAGWALPIDRQQLSALLGISLARTKRALALLSLSGALRAESRSIEVTDWRRVCSLANLDAEAFGVTADDDEDLDVLLAAESARDQFYSRTAGGEPACFV